MGAATSASTNNSSTHGQVRSLVLAPVAAIGWLSFALLGFAVRVVLFRTQRTPGATAVLWGLGFGLFLWAGSLSVGLDEGRAIPFGLVAGAAITLFVYLRGAALENPPAALDPRTTYEIATGRLEDA